MRLWKLSLICLVVAGGFGTGYLFKGRQTVVSGGAPVLHTPPSSAEAPALGYDPSLVLPPPATEGVLLDHPPAALKDHFKALAGLSSNDSKRATEEPGLLTADLNTTLPPTVVIPVELKAELQPPVIDPLPLPRTIVRLPAPPERTTALAAPIRAIRADIQQGPWMYVNTRDIQLSFDITRRGSSGVKAVELWGRRSDNEEYVCYDRMEGDNSPFRTRLWSEGDYEFRMVFVSGTGVKSPTPKREEAPDIYVCLDTRAPAVAMMPPQASESERGVINLRWQAVDQNLAENPIRLEYSADGAIWTSMTPQHEWLPNTGQYEWRVPTGLPSELRLRVRARDRAGNIGESLWSSTYAVDLTVPEGRINGFVEALPMPRVQNQPVVFLDCLRTRGELTDNPELYEVLPTPREMK